MRADEFPRDAQLRNTVHRGGTDCQRRGFPVADHVITDFPIESRITYDSITTPKNALRRCYESTAIKFSLGGPEKGGVVKVITAAHCLDDSKNPNDYTIVFGMHQTNVVGTRVIWTPVSITVHQQYNTRTFSNDIAVIGMK
ncbi:hypothetical protein DPMN_035487 [Dreissena polymorpha]|uniref:Peptidase S1 domain-containing protein n=1 Tax=Dreissena polymorpha TaxID=45954 RepID=A0A9D4M7E0_DREPO|nr:hypothetical protein DPMN_035487 [Dreissena polymorpha]